MAGHAKIIIAAPNIDLSLSPGVLFGLWEVVSVPVDLLEHSVGMVHLLLHDLLFKEGLIVEGGPLFQAQGTSVLRSLDHGWHEPARSLADTSGQQRALVGILINQLATIVPDVAFGKSSKKWARHFGNPFKPYNMVKSRFI